MIHKQLDKTWTLAKLKGHLGTLRENRHLTQYNT